MEKTDLLSQVAARLAAAAPTSARRKTITTPSTTLPKPPLFDCCPFLPCPYLAGDTGGRDHSSDEGRTPSLP